MREIRYLTALRGVLACWVMLYHVALLAGQNEPAFSVGPAYLAVDCFFILSGFVLVGGYGNLVLSGGGYAKFVWRRIARLFPVHLAAVTLVGVKMTAAQTLGETLLLNRGWPWLGSPGEWWRVNAINVPDWSISTEWAASLLFPVFVIAILRGGRGRLVAAVSFLVGKRGAPVPRNYL
jgi:peptidoglycan/LPS O-acetylase OafA/YrhL